MLTERMYLVYIKHGSTRIEAKKTENDNWEEV